MNIIIAITDKNKDGFGELLTNLADYDNFNVCVGVEEKNQALFEEFSHSQHVSLLAFQNGSSMESIINSLQRKAKFGATLVLRKAITIEELVKFVNCDKEVATCRVERSKVKNFFFNIWQSMLKFFLGVKEYEGDTSAVFLNEDVNAVVGESGNLSFSTRVNRWRGIEQATIEVKGEPVKKEVDKKTITKFSLIAIFSALVAIIVTTVLCLTVKVSIIIGLLIICLDMICLAVSLITTIITIFNWRVGNKKIDIAV